MRLNARDRVRISVGPFSSSSGGFLPAPIFSAASARARKGRFTLSINRYAPAIASVRPKTDQPAQAHTDADPRDSGGNTTQ